MEAMERKLPVGREEVEKALELLQKYKAGKASLEQRIIANEEWWKLRHWEQIRRQKKDPEAAEPASAWLQNCVANKHADAMDQFPEAIVLPREESDRQAAELLNGILPAILEQNDYEEVYSRMWWYKLKSGTGVTGVFWDPEKNNGLGDIDIRALDLLNLFWEPGVRDVEDSANLFYVELEDKAEILRQYPLLELGGRDIDLSRYIYEDGVDSSEKLAVIDWYYKRRIGGKEVLHFAKIAAGQLLYASENDPALYLRGFYDHGKYPVVFDALFPEEGTPAGYGYVDVCKDPQTHIDRLNQAILKNALMAARPRFFVRGDGSINEEEYGDWNRDFVHYHGSGSPSENLQPVEVRTLPEIYVAILNNKIAELKETSGNRDFNSGGTTSGVTAASAIAALQEAGNKLSRDMIKSSYRAFSRCCQRIIELIRQFYDTPRCFRIMGPNGETEFSYYTNASIRPQPMLDLGVELGYRLPVFDVSVKTQKANAFSRLSHNELAMQLFGAGFFKGELAREALIALEMMDFEGKDRVIRRVAENAGFLSAPREGAGEIPGGIFKGSEGEVLRAYRQLESLPLRKRMEEERMQ